MDTHAPDPVRSRRIIPVLAAVALVVVALAIFSGRLSLRDLTVAIAGCDAVTVLVLMSLLPVAGFSVAVMYVVAGIKFGPYGGGLAVALATSVHLVAIHWISRTFLRGPLQQLLARRGRHLPHAPREENVAIAAMAALVPGLPYFARNYLLALTDVPFRTTFAVCLPIYVIRSYVAILVGDVGADLDRRALLLLGAIYAVKLAICAVLLWRIRRRLRARAEANRALVE